MGDDSPQKTRAGPTAKSMFGPQVMSHRRSSPSYGFGSGGRSPKLYISAEHAKDFVNHEVPGPDRYNVQGSMFTQHLSKYSSAPAPGFGSAKRFATTQNHLRGSTPGPGTYRQVDSMGMQLRSHHKTMPTYGFGSSTREHTSRVFISREHALTTAHDDSSPGPAGRHSITGSFGTQHLNYSGRSCQFGTDTRFKYEAEVKHAKSTPGPGTYNVNPAVGRQLTSDKATGASFGFGSGDRRHASKVYISSEHAKSTNVDTSPGPAALGATSSFGRSTSTTSRTSNSWSFGKADRFGYQVSVLR